MSRRSISAFGVIADALRDPLFSRLLAICGHQDLREKSVGIEIGVRDGSVGQRCATATFDPGSGLLARYRFGDEIALHHVNVERGDETPLVLIPYRAGGR